MGALSTLVLLYGLLVPLAKVMEKTGLWLRLANRRRRGRRFQGKFGDYQGTAHDVFACVYFKSGTNWLMQILVQIIHHGAAEFEHVHDMVPGPTRRTLATPLLFLTRPRGRTRRRVYA